MDAELKSHFIMLYQMVLADGVVDIEEINTLCRIGNEKYGITPEQINQFIKDADVLPSFPVSMEDKISLLFQLAKVAWADGRLDDSERSLMKKYIIAMKFDPMKAEEIANFMFEQVKQNLSEKEVLNLILNN